MSSPDFQRWYDKDPALSQAIETLRHAEDKYQAQIALNIILIIVEHQIEDTTHTNVEELVNSLVQTKPSQNAYYRRWYDLNETLRSAMQLLYDCPDEVQQQVIPSICTMIEGALNQNV